MLLFHGTGGPRSMIEKIFEEGLRPHGGRDWAHAMTKVDAHVFACTTPVGSRDGDPIRFAQRGAWKKNRAWMIVLDVPRDSPLVVGVIGNGELARYWSLRAFATSAVEGKFGQTRAVLALARDSKRDLRDLITHEVFSVAPGLVEGTPDAATLVQFERAYLRASWDDKDRVARSYGLTIPRDFAEDPHYAACAGCMHNLFEVEFVARDVLWWGKPARFHRGSFDRLEIETFCAHAEALGRWLASYDSEHIDRFVRKRDGVPWRELQRALPPPAELVPRTFWPDIATRDLDERLAEPDMQVMLHAVPPEHIVGAFELGSSNQLSSLVRPRDGELLPNKLLHIAHELREQRETSARPILLRD
jgi:hypothetical protein